MFKVNRATEYAILLLINLKVGKENLKSLTEVAKLKNLPIKYTEKIAKKLKKAEIIGSKEGINGGYFLKKRMNNISISEIIHAIQGKKGLVTCIHGQCSYEDSCLHKNVWFRLQKKLEQELESIKLAELVNES